MKSFMIILIKLYRAVLSPILPRACRYEPTCSQYMIDAIGAFGPIKGGAKGAWRIIRCNPFGGHGYDPAVPAKPTAQKEPHG